MRIPLPSLLRSRTKFATKINGKGEGRYFCNGQFHWLASHIYKGEASDTAAVCERVLLASSLY